MGLFQRKQPFFYHNFDTETKDREMIMEMNADTERMQRRITRLKEAYPNYRGILEFFEKLLLEQLKTMAKVKYRPPEISEDRARIRAREGFPMLSKGDFPIDPRLAGQLFRSICRIAKGENEKLKAEVGGT